MIIRKLVLLFVLLPAWSSATFAQSITRLDNSKISFSELDKKIRSLMRAANVQGLAVTIFNHNEPVYKKPLAIKEQTQRIRYIPTQIFMALR
jgi:CubicO group peptidase (beta-lactamase class C family)